MNNVPPWIVSPFLKKLTLGCQIDKYTRLFGTKETWRMKQTQRQTRVFNENLPYSFIWPYSFNWHLRVSVKSMFHFVSSERSICKGKVYIFWEGNAFERATQFCVSLTYFCPICRVPVKSKVKISQNFVAFSEYMNFTKYVLTKYTCNFYELLIIRTTEVCMKMEKYLDANSDQKFYMFSMA